MKSVLLAISLSAAVGAGAALAQPMTHGAAAAPMSDDAIIASALKAAPPAVARNATVVAPTADGGMRVVRKGTGEFTCMADNPATPGPDPMCMDKNALAWGEAWMAHKPPPQTVGFMYMLAGGTDASNTDPYATAPSTVNHWITTGPHVMVVGAPDLLQNYPSSPDPDTSQPYVMWSGTPYAHLMIPVH
jgi:hypothetical protein